MILNGFFSEPHFAGVKSETEKINTIYRFADIDFIGVFLKA